MREICRQDRSLGVLTCFACFTYLFGESKRPRWALSLFGEPSRLGSLPTFPYLHLHTDILRGSELLVPTNQF